MRGSGITHIKATSTYRLKANHRLTNESGLAETDERKLPDGVGDGSHQQDRAIQGHRPRRKVIFAYPASDKWEKRKPEKQVQIGPQVPQPSYSL